MLPVKYYEAHITLDPVNDDKREELKTALSWHDFRLAKLFMQKGVASTLDAFATGHDKDYTKLLLRTEACVKELSEQGFAVRRRKIEAVVYDERT